MAEDLPTVEGPRVTTLVNGIVHDAQELLHQQIALFKHEVRENLRKTKEAAQSLSLGAGLGMTGGLFLGFMLVYVLHEVWPRLPLWASFGIIGAALLIAAGVLIYLGRKKLETVSAVPEQSLAALKENVAWITNRK